MTTITTEKKFKKEEEIEKLKIKALLFDELLEFIEEKYLGYLMKLTEKEKNISLSEAKKLLKINESIV